VTAGKPPSEAVILRENIEEQALVSYINGLTDEMRFELITKKPTSLDRAMQVVLVADKNIRTYNNAREIFRSSNNENDITGPMTVEITIVRTLTVAKIIIRIRRTTIAIIILEEIIFVAGILIEIRILETTILMLGVVIRAIA